MAQNKQNIKNHFKLIHTEKKANSSKVFRLITVLNTFCMSSVG